jgi:hypothetical protein
LTDRLDLLAALLSDTSRSADVPLDAIAALLEAIGVQEAKLGTVKAVLAARLAGGQGNGRADRLVTADEACERLGVTKDWLRRNRELPFVYKLSDGVVRYSVEEMERWKRTRRPC